MRRESFGRLVCLTLAMTRIPVALLCLLIPAACPAGRAVPLPGDIGPAVPTAGIEAADDGRWFVLCQARDDTDHDGTLQIKYDIHYNHGDLARPYLVLGSGNGEAIEYPAAQSAHGEWLAVVQSGKLVLIDAATFHRAELAADLMNDNEWLETKNSRFISIAGNASRLAYLRADNAIVIRELPSGRERVVAMTAKVWRATVDSTGTWAEVRVLSRDTNHDGKITWRGGPNTVWFSTCNADVLHRKMFEPTDGDAPTTRWLELATGNFVDDPTVIGTVGGELLHRQADDALVLGTQRIVEPSCHARVDGVLDVPARVLVTCGPATATDSGYHPAPIMVAGHGVLAQSADTQGRNSHDDLLHHDRFRWLGDRRFADYADGSTITLPGDRAASFQSQYLLVDGPTGLAAFDLVTRTATPLGVGGRPADDMSQGDVVAIGGLAYDLHNGKSLGPAETLAFVSSSRRALRFAATAKRGFASFGPLRWAP
jgi:hypothetical protein